MSGTASAPGTGSLSGAATPSHAAVQTIQIELGERSYPIVIGSGVLQSPENWAGLPRASTAVVVSNVTVAQGDGARGWAGSGAHAAPYDVIIVSGSLPMLPQSLLEQVKVGGRLLAIVGEAPVMEACLVKRTAADAWDTVTLFETSARPLRNAEAPSPFHF